MKTNPEEGGPQKSDGTAATPAGTNP
jgi:hypothetical protein